VLLDGMLVEILGSSTEDINMRHEHNELHNLYSTPNTVRIINSRKVVNYERDEKGRKYLSRKALREEINLVI
jgi:hypothetical protein